MQRNAQINIEDEVFYRYILLDNGTSLEYASPTLHCNQCKGKKLNLTCTTEVQQIQEMNKFEKNGVIYKPMDTVLYESQEYDLYCIGIIDLILTARGKTVFKIRQLLRPEQLKDTMKDTDLYDWNYIFWTDNFRKIDVSMIKKKCPVSYRRNFRCTSVSWFHDVKNCTFYFDSSYDTKEKALSLELPERAKLFVDTTNEADNDSQTEPEPLKCFDIFAGCGGFSEGLSQSNFCETKWFIEKCPEAAKAFEINHLQVTKFLGDANDILQNLRENSEHSKKYPQKGEVDVICGGPPCQGHSRMNQYQNGEEALDNNSLIGTFLSVRYNFFKFFTVLAR